MAYNMAGEGGERSVWPSSLALHLIFCCRHPFFEVYSKVKLELSLVFPTSFPLILMLVNILLVVLLLTFVYFMARKPF